MFLGPTSIRFYVRIRLVSEEMVFGLRKGNDFPRLSCLLDKPLIILAQVYKCIVESNTQAMYHTSMFSMLHAIHTYLCSSTLQ